jgi:hypothetical protein
MNHNADTIAMRSDALVMYVCTVFRARIQNGLIIMDIDSEYFTPQRYVCETNAVSTENDAMNMKWLFVGYFVWFSLINRLEIISTENL